MPRKCTPRALVAQNGAPSREPDNIQSLQAATKCCPCHANVHPDTGNAAQATNFASQVKVLRLSRKTGPPAACSTTSNPFRQLPMPCKRTPRCRKCCAGHEICPSRELDNIQSVQAAAKGCPCHGNVHPDAGNAAPAMKFASHFQKCCACHAKRGP